MFRSRKGLYGYFNAEKKRRILMTVITYAVPLILLAAGIMMTKTRNNILTVVAMVCVIPAAMSTVGMIMMLFRKSISKEEYDAIDPHIGTLTFAYELYMTSEKQNALVDCVVFCGNEVVGLVTDPKTDLKFAQSHLQKMLRSAGYKVSVHMLGDVKHFTDRLDTLNEHAKELRKGIPFTPDERYPGFDREDMIREAALHISL